MKPTLLLSVLLASAFAAADVLPVDWAKERKKVVAFGWE